MSALLFLPGAWIHTPFYADTREPRSWVTVHTSGIEAGLGEQLALVGQGDPARADGEVSWSLGLAAGVFMGFEPGDELTFNLMTFDGMFGVPLDVGRGPWELRLMWAHESAHFADGMRFSSSRPPPDETRAYSREWVQVQAAWHLGVVVPYVGLQQVVHSVAEGEGPGVQAGLVADARGRAAPYLGADVQASQEVDWRPTFSVQAGLRVDASERRCVRLGVLGYAGLDDAGRRYLDEERYVGLTLGLDHARERPPAAS